MTKQPFRFTFFLLICLTLPLTATAQDGLIGNLDDIVPIDPADEPITIPDPNLRAAVERELSKAAGETITRGDMEGLPLFYSDNSNISVLTGLEHATNLTHLNLSDNNISDISAVSGLTKLTQLHLFDNNISDISAVSGLTNLTHLALTYNNISDISAVSGLTKLTQLHLFDNNISDISAVSGLTNLTSLTLTYNNISDIAAVSGLTKLKELYLQFNSISDIAAVSGLTNLTSLWAERNSISDISAVSGLTNLTSLFLSYNNISDIAAVSGLTNLTHLGLHDNNISDIAAVSGLTNLTQLSLSYNNISDISAVSGLTNLTDLGLAYNNISNISAVSGLTKLTLLSLSYNNISEISAVSGLTKLTLLSLSYNNISDISVISGLTNLTQLYLANNNISDISAVSGLTKLTLLDLRGNPLNAVSFSTHIPTLQRRGVDVRFDFPTVTILAANLRAAIEQALGKTSGETITAADMALLSVLNSDNSNIRVLTGLEYATNLTSLSLANNSISDIAALSGLTNLTELNLRGNPLNTVSLNTHIPTLVGRGVNVQFDNFESIQFDLSVPAGLSLLHVPLQVTTVDGVPKTIESIADLYDALGGAGAVNFLITYDSQTQGWVSYVSALDKGTTADKALTDDIGIIAGMTTPVSIHLRGNALGTNGNSTVSLNQGLNLVGLPLRDSRVTRVSDLFALDGIGGNVPLVILTDNGEFKTVGGAGDPGDIPIIGGQAFILQAQRAATVAISGEAWTNTAAMTAPLLSLKSIEMGYTMPVLVLRGSIVDAEADLNKAGLQVIVKNLSTPIKDRESVTGSMVTGMTGVEGGGYQLTVVDMETARAARIGDILEISVESLSPFIGVQPLQYTVTTEDVKRSWILLPDLVLYEIPSETKLLPNYPNPFNPETWIPYQLAKPAEVTITLYAADGRLIRILALGHQLAGVYENKSRAAYWDGRNAVGEPVAGGVYFYQLTAGDFSETRKMVILK